MVTQTAEQEAHNLINLDLILSKLRMADTCLSHKYGIVKWHAHLFAQTTQYMRNKRFFLDVNLQELFSAAVPADTFDWFGFDLGEGTMSG